MHHPRVDLALDVVITDLGDLVGGAELTDDLGLAGVGERVQEEQDRGGDEERDARVERLERLDPEQGAGGLRGVRDVADEAQPEPPFAVRT